MRNPFRRQASVASTSSFDDDEKSVGHRKIGSGTSDLSDYAAQHTLRSTINSAQASGMMAQYISDSLAGKLFSMNTGSGAAIRIAKNDYAMYPSLEAQTELAAYALGLHKLDVDVSFCLGSELVKTICDSLKPGHHMISLTPSSQVQVVESMEL